jgi:hypothetical protein
LLGGVCLSFFLYLLVGIHADIYVAKYNYVLAAALDTGLALSAIIIFFCITYPGAVFPNWWGEYIFPLNTGVVMLGV